MKPVKMVILAMIIFSLIFIGGCSTLHPSLTPSSSPPTPTTPPAPQINLKQLYQTLQDLTGVQSYSGWRTSATQGEKEAFDFVHQKLSQMDNLKNGGIVLTRDSFHVFLATEIHETTLILTLDGKQVSIPVNGLRGARDNIQSALRLDSDGTLNDRKPDPVTVSGSVYLLQNGSNPADLEAGSLKGKILFLDYALIDTVTNHPNMAALRMRAAIAAQPSGIVFVTEYSNLPGISHGTYVADLGVISQLVSEPSIPTVYMRLEDLVEGGSDPWNKLKEFDSAELTWDTDVLSPADSGNLIAKIPGKNHDRAILLSAHIDSANTPGALDDGAGSAILLEVAAAIDEAKVTPEFDLYLVWYGSEEIGLLGSANFTASHQEILDKLIGMLNIDCLSRPVEGAPATLNFAYGSGMEPDNTDDPWVNFLVGRAGTMGIDVQQVYLPLASDNSSFAGYNVANLDLIYDSDEMMQNYGGVWFAGHLHDPYDEVKLVRQVETQFLQMANIALDTALLPADVSTFRQKAAKSKRVLIIASHTEDVLLTPAGLFDLGLAFENAGLDVDVVPYGTLLKASDLENAKLAIALPIFDLPSGPEANTLYDEAWTQDEINILKEYVDAGGSLVITNASRRVKYYNTLYEANEDWAKMDALIVSIRCDLPGTPGRPGIHLEYRSG